MAGTKALQSKGPRAYVLTLFLFLALLILKVQATTVFKVYPLAEDYF